MGRRYIPITPPAYYENPLLKKTQGDLYDLGTNVLSGDLPDYYKPIGESGGAVFQDYLSNIVKKVTGATTSAIARKGTARSGEASSVISKTVGDVSKELNWQDYLRMLTGRTNLLNLGTGTVNSVADRSLSEQSVQNQFNMGVYQTQEQANQFKYADMQSQHNLEQQMKSQLLSSIFGAGLGSIASVASAGIMGSASGAGGLTSSQHFANTFAPSYVMR